MEENIDSTKNSPSNDGESLKKDTKVDNVENKLTDLNNTKPKENNLNSNNQNINEVMSNETNNEKIKKTSDDLKIIPKKEIPIEKKPFGEFVNDHLLPSLISELQDRGFEVTDLNLKNTFRPIAGDKCWVIYCEIKDTCNFWLSFEKEDISSLKSISICRTNQKPSVIESFLIDEKRITLKLIISRILQRLNGQKLIGIN